MELDEMKEQAKAEVQAYNPNATELKVTKIYDNILDGTLLTISYKDKPDRDELAHVHFSGSGRRFYRYHADVLNEVSHYKERRWVFRFLEIAGVGGLIAFTLILIFSVLLCALALSGKDVTSSPVIEVVKLSFTTILGYFFGSQTSGRK